MLLPNLSGRLGDIISYLGTPAVCGSSNSQLIRAGVGKFVSVCVTNLSACSFQIFDANASTAGANLSGIAGNVLFTYQVNAAATTNNRDFSPSIPIKYGFGLFVNASGTTNYTVTYQ
jgi:hypothetical protein